MTQDLGQTIKEMSEIDFPDGLHGKIMRQIVFLKFRTPFITVVTLLVLNLFFSGARILERLATDETLETIIALWQNVEFTLRGLAQFGEDLFEVIPVGYGLIFICNFLVLAYVTLYLPQAFRKFKPALREVA
ncbi:MAG: hypothetical protein NT003_04720 [Candidatus Magasanikbacteria bacterium]|nr:hypothetical protein [Candidatus Magasanikbacteria bacterium]